VSLGGRTHAVYLSEDLRREVAAGLRRHKDLVGLLEKIAKADTEALRHRARRYRKRG
jgi:hypothetical protein